MTSKKGYRYINKSPYINKIFCLRENKYMFITYIFLQRGKKERKQYVAKHETNNAIKKKRLMRVFA